MSDLPVPKRASLHVETLVPIIDGRFVVAPAPLLLSGLIQVAENVLATARDMLAGEYGDIGNNLTEHFWPITVLDESVGLYNLYGVVCPFEDISQEHPIRVDSIDVVAQLANPLISRVALATNRKSGSMV